MCRYWRTLFPDVDLLVAFGGYIEQFKKVSWEKKIFIDDSSLRTRDHQRECQSYVEVYRAVREYFASDSVDELLFSEFDHIPLRKDFFTLLSNQMDEEGADVLMHGLTMVNNTGHAHYLYHANMLGFFQQIANFSIRPDTSQVLSAYGFGQYWKWEAFEQMAIIKDEVGCYLELWSPTVAHHLGYRVKATKDHWHTHDYYGDQTASVEGLKKLGCWSVHPAKNHWDSDIDYS